MNTFDSEKNEIKYWFKEVEWAPKTLKRVPSIRPISTSPFTQKCFESSFLFRVFYRYQTYISKYSQNQTTGTWSPSGPKLLTLSNSLTLALEQTVLTDYAQSYLTAFPGCLAFPPNVVEFLWNFFSFLSATDSKLNCIIPLETCPDVFEAFSSALKTIQPNAHTQKNHSLCVMSIILRTDVSNRLAKFFREKK